MVDHRRGTDRIGSRRLRRVRCLSAPVAPQGAPGSPERVGYRAVHQVLVPDGMGGFIHIDHLLLTPRGILLLDTRRVAGLIFGGDQMSDWTVMGRRRFTFDIRNPRCSTA